MLKSAPSPPSQPSHLSKPQRVLACLRCQQRKVKCDRNFPCANCNTARAQCVPATLTPRGRRRRRFPERELLERLHKYEDMLRQQNIKFEPLHKDQAREKEFPSTQGADESDNEQFEVVGLEGGPPSTTIRSEERAYEAKNFLHALNSGFRDTKNDSDSCDDSDLSQIVFRKGWDQLFGDNDHLLFGSPNTATDLSTLHPEPVQIFRLWQTYLDNVNPLLKVTHTSSLQGRIIEAASNLKTVNPTLEALMFSIYCMAILSLTVDECGAIFGSSKGDLLTRFQFGCRQALLNSGFLRSSDRECLTALYLYLVSVRPSTVPQSLSAMLGVAIRVAQRMGIHSESALIKCSAFEAELRRRLWWSLVLFDTRTGELADSRTATLAPTWDCRTPLNVNDFDLRPEMKDSPADQGKLSDALFTVVYSELGEFVRSTAFYLDFNNPALKPLSKAVQHSTIPEAEELGALEKVFEDKYLKFCDSENPLHFMTIWWLRGYLAKYRLLEYHARCSSSSESQTDIQRDIAISHALRMLECDAKIMNSPTTKRFLWLMYFYFPFPAYIQILQDLRRRPNSEQAEQAWEVMSDNYEARFAALYQKGESPFFRIFTKLVLQSWGAREAAFSQRGEPLVSPRIVSSIRDRFAQGPQIPQVVNTTQQNNTMSLGIDHFPLSMSISHRMLHNIGGQDGFEDTGPVVYPSMPRQALLDADVDHLDWAAMDWGYEAVHSGAWNSEL